MNVLSHYRPYLFRSSAVRALSAPLLLCCGLMAILSWAAPEYLQTIIPGWRDKWGLVLVIGVVYGFCRAVVRLLFRAAGLVFWSVAIVCLLGTSFRFLPEGLKSFSLPKFSMPSGNQASAPQPSPSTTIVRATKLTGNLAAPALPEPSRLPGL